MTEGTASAEGEEALRPYAFDPATIKHRTPPHPTRDDIVVMSPEFHADPGERSAWMRVNAPLYWDDVTGLWAVTSHELISRIEADWETFCSAKGSRPESSVPSMINMDPPHHTKRRRLVSSGFTPRRVSGHEDFLRATVNELIDEVIDDGGCDFVTDIAQSIPLRMIAKLMGLPLADEEKLLHWSDLFATGGEEIRDQVLAAIFEWIEYVQEHTATRDDPAAEDLISLLIHNDDPLDSEALIYETMLILVGGDETTRHVMSGGLQALLQHPDQLAALKDDPTMLPDAIEEMLRWVTPVRNMNRTATTDVTVAGQQVLEGDRLLLLYLSGNRDDAVFDEPETFDIGRTPNPHVAFGANGRHFCLGANLARLELKVLFEELFRRIPDIRLAEPDVTQPERRGNFVLGMEHLPVQW